MNLPEQIKQMEDIEKENDAKLKDEAVLFPKELSEVEQAQQTVKSWTDKIAFHEKELHFAKKNLKIHERALKALIELEKEMSG